MSRVTTSDLLAARQVVKDLQAADVALSRATTNTGDHQTLTHLAPALKSTRDALRRAKLLVKDADLKTAPQSSLGLEPGGQPGR